MVFVFGTTERSRSRGFVVDRCPSCLDLRWFEVLDHHRAWHAYFVPLGRGRYLFTSQRCDECGAAFPLEGAKFVTTLDEREAGELDLSTGLRRTNPELARRFDEIDALAPSGVTPYRATEADDTLLAPSLERLRELERRGVDTSRFVQRLRDWSRLAPGERERLCAELEGFHAATTS